MIIQLDHYMGNCSSVLFSLLVKLGELQDALESFQEALELGKILEDEAAVNAVSKAIRDVNERIAQGKDTLCV